MTTADSDFCSVMGTGQQYLLPSSNNNIIMSGLATSQDFQQDNSDYYYDLGSNVNHPSVLSSLSASYNGIGELSFYDDLAKNIDVDLAEIDMESFRTEDIHNLLKQRCSHSLDGAGAEDRLVTSSIYRSEVLFSPVHESVHISVDSLDMSNYPNEEDIILTCKANKDNYTIAFEGSIAYSDASFYGLPDNYNHSALNDFRRRDLCEKLAQKKGNLKMSTSDYNLTTWSKLKKTHNSSNLNKILTQTSPVKESDGLILDPFSGNQKNQLKMTGSSHLVAAAAGSGNEPKVGMSAEQHDLFDFPINLRRTKSLSDFFAIKYKSKVPNNTDTHPGHGQFNQDGEECSKVEKLNVSQAAINNNLNHNFVDTSSYSNNKLRSLLPNCAMPMQQLSTTSESGNSPLNQSNLSNEQNSSNNSNCNQNANNSEKQPSFNLVKLFIKQKSSSTDTCMDVSSGCWPSDSSSSLEQNQSQNPVINNNIINRNYHKKSVSNLARHDEEEYLDSLDAQINNNGQPKGSKSKILNVRGVVDQNKNFNILNNNLETNNNLINNLINNNHMSTDDTSNSRTSDNITQIYNNMKHNQKNGLPTRIALDKITRSMQTSIPKLISSSTQYNNKPLAGRDRVKIVPMSFLKQLHQNERKTAPVYVIYPNYTLPNLDFVNRQDFILSPIEYKDPFLTMSKKDNLEKKLEQRAQRPKSFSDILDCKRTRANYQNVTDWKSLIVLLPVEYSRILKTIPEIETQLLKYQMEAQDDGFEEEAMTTSQSQKQLFCTTTPILRRQSSRPMSCDCASYVMQSSSSSSSSNQPNSSGYRGSSTILTDSELDGNITQIYDELDNNLDENQAGLPPTHCGRTPKSILRRNFNRSRGVKPQNKRNSLFDGTMEEKPVEKRRSLQEIPDYQYLDQYIDFDQPKLNPLFNYKQQCNDLGSLSKFKKKLNSELELLEVELMDRNIPRSDSKYSNEIGHILESLENLHEPYDRLKLRNNVSRQLSNQQKRVSFTEASQKSQETAPQDGTTKKSNLEVPGFTTPPNSPNISVMGCRKTEPKKKQVTEKEKQERIQSNRFKRLQIQWELLSKDSQSLMKEMNENQPAVMETKSGGSTPTGPMKSRIPRPVSYPATRTLQQDGKTGIKSSPCRIPPPKKYSYVQTPPSAPSTPRAQNRLNNTPKKTTNPTQTRLASKTR